MVPASRRRLIKKDELVRLKKQIKYFNMLKIVFDGKVVESEDTWKVLWKNIRKYNLGKGTTGKITEVEGTKCTLTINGTVETVGHRLSITVLDSELEVIPKEKPQFQRGDVVMISSEERPFLNQKRGYYFRKDDDGYHQVQISCSGSEHRKIVAIMSPGTGDCGNGQWLVSVNPKTERVVQDVRGWRHIYRLGSDFVQGPCGHKTKRVKVGDTVRVEGNRYSGTLTKIKKGMRNKKFFVKYRDDDLKYRIKSFRWKEVELEGPAELNDKQIVELLKLQ